MTDGISSFIMFPCSPWHCLILFFSPQLMTCRNGHIFRENTIPLESSQAILVPACRIPKSRGFASAKGLMNPTLGPNLWFSL